jgi:lipoprotein-anchoring transpeptidase ErfK/SrfK
MRGATICVTPSGTQESRSSGVNDEFQRAQRRMRQREDRYNEENAEAARNAEEAWRRQLSTLAPPPVVNPGDGSRCRVTGPNIERIASLIVDESLMRASKADSDARAATFASAAQVIWLPSRRPRTYRGQKLACSGYDPCPEPHTTPRSSTTLRDWAHRRYRRNRSIPGCSRSTPA